MPLPFLLALTPDDMRQPQERRMPRAPRAVRSAAGERMPPEEQEDEQKPPAAVQQAAYDDAGPMGAPPGEDKAMGGPNGAEEPRTTCRECGQDLRLLNPPPPADMGPDEQQRRKVALEDMDEELEDRDEEYERGRSAPPAILSAVMLSGWNEEDHPRDEGGKFTSGGGGGGTPKGDGPKGGGGAPKGGGSLESYNAARNKADLKRAIDYDGSQMRPKQTFKDVEDHIAKRDAERNAIHERAKLPEERAAKPEGTRGSAVRDARAKHVEAALYWAGSGPVVREAYGDGYNVVVEVREQDIERAVTKLERMGYRADVRTPERPGRPPRLSVYVPHVETKQDRIDKDRRQEAEERERYDRGNYDDDGGDDENDGGWSSDADGNL